ncbi:protein giant-lens [Photinus pyralis]|uniref:Protein giant-lens n=1 Tax=Photinus pyralis TaxID=7054 RepID=A0A1Y1N3L0_PHOPY|nr:protein giant-lens [Photinus pyralis]
MYAEILAVLILVNTTYSSKLPLEVFQQYSAEHHLHHHHHHSSEDYKKKMAELNNFRTLYQLGNSESHLPVCSAWAICSRIDLYETPWLERTCRCPNDNQCPSSIISNDGYTLLDRHRQYKLCEPIKKLPKCRYFRDITWTYISKPDNFTEQIVHCHCPKNSVTYLIKPLAHHLPNGRIEYRYSFACSPQSKLRCQRKEPCRLFTVHKRPELLDEVNTNTLCQCPHAHKCPHHHTDYGVIAGKSYTEEAVSTYSGFCLPI